MKRALIVTALGLVSLFALPAPAAADITAFLGVSPTPANHRASGFAIGINIIVVGFEFEYSKTAEDAVTKAPALKTMMGNLMVQTPTGGVQLYGTIGGGLFNEVLGARSETSFGMNVGGGAKIHLAGPVKLRLDYRVFTLRGDPLYSNPKRFYAGVSFSF